MYNLIIKTWVDQDWLFDTVELHLMPVWPLAGVHQACRKLQHRAIGVSLHGSLPVPTRRAAGAEANWCSCVCNYGWGRIDQARGSLRGSKSQHHTHLNPSLISPTRFIPYSVKQLLVLSRTNTWMDYEVLYRVERMKVSTLQDSEAKDRT